MLTGATFDNTIVLSCPPACADTRIRREERRRLFSLLAPARVRPTREGETTNKRGTLCTLQEIC